MPTPRDALIFSITAIACVASVASDTYTAGNALLEDLALDETVVVSLEVTIDSQTMVSAVSALDTELWMFVAVEADDEASIELVDEVEATLFPIVADERGEALFVAAVGNEEPRTVIDDCACGPCTRTFELEIVAPDGFVGEASVNAGAWNYVSKGIDLTMQVVD